VKSVSIKSNNSINIVEMDKKYSLEQLQKEVGGWIEVVKLNGKMSMYVNEEGLMRQFKINPIATSLYFQYTGINTPIVGDVIITGRSSNGSQVNLKDECVEEIMSALK
jgi:hypothetical protein